MEFTFRPLDRWPHPETRNRRSGYVFKASWQSTMNLLRAEILAIGGSDAIIGAGFDARDIRFDGLPRADARKPKFPGVEISFTVPKKLTPVGRLIYATDSTSEWEANVRCIALGLNALRSVDRYGISRRGEQYAGFAALTSGSGPDTERGRKLVEEAGGMRNALFKHHPDRGGEQTDFEDVQAYRELVGGAA